MNIREGLVADCEIISALAIYVWLNTYSKEGVGEKVAKFVFEEFSISKVREILESVHQKILLLEDGSQLIGLAVIDQNSRYLESTEFGFEICNLYVHPHFQGRGAGGALLESLRSKYGEHSWLTTWIYNHPAIQFYKKNGYTIIGKAEFRLFDTVHENHVLSNL